MSIVAYSGLLLAGVGSDSVFFATTSLAPVIEGVFALIAACVGGWLAYCRI